LCVREGHPSDDVTAIWRHMGFPSEEEKCNKGLTVDKSLQKIGHTIQVC